MSRQSVDGLLQVLDVVQERIRAVNREVRQRAKSSPQARRLQTIPGVGWFGALLILAEIGDIRRFSEPKQLVSYARLAPSVHSAGGHTRYGRITKQGSPWLRWMLVEAAIHASRRPDQLRDRYLKLARRKDGKTARVAVARHLAKVVYFLLSWDDIYRENTRGGPAVAA